MSREMKRDERVGTREEGEDEGEGNGRGAKRRGHPTRVCHHVAQHTLTTGFVGLSFLPSLPPLHLPFLTPSPPLHPSPKNSSPSYPPLLPSSFLKQKKKGIEMKWSAEYCLRRMYTEKYIIYTNKPRTKSK